MGPRRIPLIALVLMLVWRVTFGQLSRMRGFPSIYGSSESPCGPGAPMQQAFQQPSFQPATNLNRRASPGGGFNPFGQSFNPYQAAMLDIDIPPAMFAGGFPMMGFQQPQRFNPRPPSSFTRQQPTYARQPARVPTYARRQSPNYARRQSPTYARSQSPTYARSQRPTYARSQSTNYARQPAATYGRQPSTFTSSAVSSYPVHVSRRRVKRQMMMPRMNCQCDSAADCNMYATMAGRSYSSQCSRRLGLVCCCRGA